MAKVTITLEDTEDGESVDVKIESDPPLDARIEESAVPLSQIYAMNALQNMLARSASAKYVDPKHQHMNFDEDDEDTEC